MDLKEQARVMLAQWKAAEPGLERARAARLREQEVASALKSLEDAFAHALREMPVRDSSGLVEMQRLLARLPRDSDS